MTDDSVLHLAAFTADGAGGNPAGVVLDASGLTDAARLAVAADVGYSETAFVVPTGEPGRFTVRYWSPVAEVGFCGHATVAAAVALAERDGVGPLVFDTLVGPVDVETRREGGAVVATLTSVPTRSAPADPADVEAALRALGWSADELDPRFPAHVAHGGMDHLVLVAASRERLAALDYDVEALGALMAARGWITVDLLWCESPTVFHARNPFPPGGVYEDPATGAAAAAFGGYLRATGLVDLPVRVTVHQGADMGRPSLLLLDLAADDDRSRVTGSGATIEPSGA